MSPTATETVSVLMTDLVGSTAIADRVGPAAAGPSRCAVVEDTPSGVTAAVSEGMRALGYAADRDEAALRRAGAETVFALDELPATLGLTI